MAEAALGYVKIDLFLAIHLANDDEQSINIQQIGQANYGRAFQMGQYSAS
jgi:hypothetical protein